MDKAELMQKEIEDKRRLPEELKKEIKKTIFHNLLIAIIIIVYICIVNILFYKLDNNIFEQYMKFFALGLICITVVSFEIAYRKQSKRTAIIGIELLLCSIISLYIPYIYLFTEVNLKTITTVLPLSIAGYYLIKAIIIYKTGEIKHQNNLSDVKEILKDTERIGYLEEESKKTYREIKKQEEENKKELLEEQRKKAAINKKQASKNKPHKLPIKSNSKTNSKLNTKSNESVKTKVSSENKKTTKRKNKK